MGQEEAKMLEQAEIKEADPQGFASFFEKNKTFKPKKNLETKDKRRSEAYQSMKASMKATLGGLGDMRQAVQKPDGEALEEWLAVNTVHFFNAASMVYGTCAEFCTEQSCPTMSAGPKYEYLWADGTSVKKPIRVSAPQYIEYLFTWIDGQISDHNLFPVEEGAKFPPAFIKTVKNIFKRLFRLYGHVYYNHFAQIRAAGAEAHLNTCFKHLIYFIVEFSLVPPSEMAPLKKLINRLVPGALEKFEEEEAKKADKKKAAAAAAAEAPHEEGGGDQ